MKKSAISFLLCFLFPLFFTIPSFAQSAKDKWAISGIELGSYNTTESTSINSKGEIVWTNSNRQWEDFGWDLRDTDLSQYEGIRIVLDDSLEIPINALKLDNGYSPGHWLFHETYPGEYILYFDGRNKNSVFGYVDEMDSAYGFLIYFTVPGNKKNLITKIKSVELIKNHSSSTDKNLAPFGIQPGTTNIRAFVEDNTFIWKRGYNDSSSGWDFTGIDLSDYDRVLVEVAESDKNLNLILCDGEWKNWHCYGRIAPTVYEASLSGDGARWVDKDTHPFDLKNGLMVMLQKQDTENRLSESKTVVKTIRFLKKGEKGFADRNLEILGRGIGAIEDNTIVKENTVIWQKDNTELKCGWNLVGIDLSEYSGIRIEFEKSDLKLELTIADKEWQSWAAFRSSDPYSIEASFSGEGASWKWQDFKPYNKKDGFLIFLRFYSEKPLRKDKKTIIKRVELIKK